MNEWKPERPVWMIRRTWYNLPEYQLPTGYSLHWYKPGDEQAWVNIQTAANSTETFDADRFTRIFGRDTAEISARQCFLTDVDSSFVATATAWYDSDFEGESYGRVHWVAVIPEHQRRGLSKPLLSVVCKRLMELGHSRAYLKTSAGRLNAIRLYLKFGFVPLMRTQPEAGLWDDILSRVSKKSDQ